MILRDDQIFYGYDVPASVGGNFRSVHQQIRHFSSHIFSAKGLKYEQCTVLSKL